MLSKLRHFWAKQLTPLEEIDQLCEIIEDEGLNGAREYVTQMKAKGLIGRSQYGRYISLLDSVKGDD